MQQSTSLAVSRENPALTGSTGMDKPFPGLERIKPSVEGSRFRTALSDSNDDWMPELMFKPKLKQHNAGSPDLMLEAAETPELDRYLASYGASGSPPRGDLDLSYLAAYIQRPVYRQGGAPASSPAGSADPQAQQAACAPKACCAPFETCAIV